MKKNLHFAAKHLIVSGTVHTGHVFPQMVQWFQRRITFKYLTQLIVFSEFNQDTSTAVEFKVSIVNSI